jgi:O-antigen ligase
MIRKQLTPSKMPVRVSAEKPSTLAWYMCLYIVVAAGRIGETIPLLSGVPVARIISVLAVAFAFSKPEQLAATRVMEIPLARTAFLFFALMILSFAFSILHSVTLTTITGSVAACAVSLILIIKASSTWASARTMITACAWASGALVIASLLQFAGGRAGYLAGYDPNDLAFVLVCFLPITHVCFLTARGFRRVIFAAIGGGSIFVTLLTQSRGGFIGLGLVLILLALFPPKRVTQPVPGGVAGGAAMVEPGTKPRKPMGLLSRLAVLAALFAVAWVAVPQATRDRLTTVFSPSTDYNVTSTDEGRFLIWGRNLPLVWRQPWGYGAGASGAVDGLLAHGRYRALHNMYLEVLVELGVFGFATFLAAFLTSLRALTRVSLTKAEANDQGELPMFARGLSIGIAAASVSGFFLSMSYSNCLWILFSLACVLTKSWAPPPLRKQLASSGAVGADRAATAQRKTNAT